MKVFDPKLQEWRMIANMSTRRSSVGVGVLNNLLFAVGGYVIIFGQMIDVDLTKL